MSQGGFRFEKVRFVIEMYLEVMGTKKAVKHFHYLCSGKNKKVSGK